MSDLTHNAQPALKNGPKRNLPRVAGSAETLAAPKPKGLIPPLGSVGVACAVQDGPIQMTERAETQGPTGFVRHAKIHRLWSGNHRHSFATDIRRPVGHL